MKIKSLMISLSLIWIAGCESVVTLDLSNANQSTGPTLTDTITFDTWETVQTGIDLKQVTVTLEGSTELLDVVRIDPEVVDIEVVVDEATPKTVSHWQEELGATVVINGSYFDDQYHLVSRTQTSADSYGPWLTGTTGVFQQIGSDWSIMDAATVNLASPKQLVQSYPLLVVAGQSNVEHANADAAQRSALAVAKDGTVYFLVAEYGVLTLNQFADALTQEKLPDFEMALNLDGGTSTGLAVLSDTVNYLDDSFVVPSVIVVY